MDRPSVHLPSYLICAIVAKTISPLIVPVASAGIFLNPE